MKEIFGILDSLKKNPNAITLFTFKGRLFFKWLLKIQVNQFFGWYWPTTSHADKYGVWGFNSSKFFPVVDASSTRKMKLVICKTFSNMIYRLICSKVLHNHIWSKSFVSVTQFRLSYTFLQIKLFITCIT